MITPKQTAIGVGVTATPVVGEPIITANMLSEYVIGGLTVGAWLYILSLVSLILIIVLNGSKVFKLLKELFKA
jgi:hypothetical protein